MASIFQASTTTGSFLLTISKVICLFVQEACAAMYGGSRNCNVYQCFPQPPHNGHWTLNLTLAICFPCCFMLHFTDFYIAFLYCVSMVKSKKRPQPPLIWQIQVCHGVNTWGNFMQENLNWSILRGAKHGKGEMKSNCSWQQSISNFQRPSFTPKKGGSRKTTGVHDSFTRVSRGFTRRIFTPWSWWQSCSSTRILGSGSFCLFYLLLLHASLLNIRVCANAHQRRKNRSALSCFCPKSHIARKNCIATVLVT